MIIKFNENRKLIEDLQNKAVLQFALPKSGRGFVRKNGDLEIVKGLSVKKFGYFVERLDNDSFSYRFVYKVGNFDTEEEILDCDEEQSKDLLAFAIKLAYFFDKHPDYKNAREHDWDVLIKHSFAEGILANNTPLAKAGFEIW